MKNINPLGLFDEHFLLERLTKLKDPLVKLDEHIDWNIFAPILDVVFNKPKNSNNVGRSPFDRLMMFKIMILQSLYSLSDDQMEHQITDRRSFMRFLGLKVSDKVPDSKTIWKFCETLIQEEVIEALFYRFNQALDDQSIFAKTAQIVDASFVEVPKQRNSRDENNQIKKGQIYDPLYPVVCMDESPKQLIAETRVPIPAKPAVSLSDMITNTDVRGFATFSLQRNR